MIMMLRCLSLSGGPTVKVHSLTHKESIPPLTCLL